jgi:hypothetical protein
MNRGFQVCRGSLADSYGIPPPSGRPTNEAQNNPQTRLLSTGGGGFFAVCQAIRLSNGYLDRERSSPPSLAMLHPFLQGRAGNSLTPVVLLFGRRSAFSMPACRSPKMFILLESTPTFTRAGRFQAASRWAGEAHSRRVASAVCTEWMPRMGTEADTLGADHDCIGAAGGNPAQ